jgi:hypothetical protein
MVYFLLGRNGILNVIYMNIKVHGPEETLALEHVYFRRYLK